MSKNLICEQCGKEYTRQDYYDKHLEMHENEKQKAENNKKENEKKIDKKVAEIKTEEKITLNPANKKFWLSFWGSLESLRQQNSIMIDQFRNIRESSNIQVNLLKNILDINREIQDNTNIDKETKLRLMNLIENSLKLYDKLREPEEKTIDFVKKKPSEIEITETRESFPGFVEDSVFFNEVNEFKESFDEEIKEKEFVQADTIRTNNRELIADDNQYLLKAEIKGETGKALLLIFSNGKESWVPKSAIKSDYIPRKGKVQEFIFDEWIIDKNNILEE